MRMNLKSIFPYVFAVLSFIAVALAYFSPVLKGEKLFQSDMEQFRGMSKEIKDFRATHGEEPYWTDAAFGGMPSYQVSAYYPYDFVKSIDRLFRFLPRPADYLFLYFIGFFVLLLVLKIDWRLAMIGSLAYGFSTYFIIILGVGHNAKAHAIGYMPLVISGAVCLFQSKYFKGFFLTTVAMALEINAGHPQMTYYLMFFLFFFVLVHGVQRLREKKSLQNYAKGVLVLTASVLLAIGTNATRLMTTKSYADQSTRGKSDLTIDADGRPKEETTGLSKDYITEYSYGLMETFNLLIPRFTGGANSENLGTDSHTYAFLRSKIDRKQARQFSQNVPVYWGNQPIVAAPAYIGAVFIFLFVLGGFLLRGPLKKALLVTTVFSILMSWGHHVELLTNFFIDHIPFYNKFRAVSSIQVLAEICIPLMGVLALQAFVFGEQSLERKKEALKKSFFLTGGVVLFFLLFGRSLFGFEGANDAYYNRLLNGLATAIVADRKTLFFEDSLRTFLLIFASAALLWAFLKSLLKRSYFYLLLAGLLLFDMIGTARRYVDTEDFYPAIRVEKPFAKSTVDQQILEDQGHYRVANLMGNFMNEGATSYFHKSIGGYHAAKLGRYQELADFHLSKNNVEAFHMLNTKYWIVPDAQGQRSVQINLEANGNAWFVQELKWVTSADEEILSLSDFDSKKTAIINAEEFPALLDMDVLVSEDSLAKIDLVNHRSNAIAYRSKSDSNRLAVFSEIYYKDGWNAYIDGRLVPHYRANYVLRALPVPEGEHLIEFKFEPAVVARGSRWVLFSTALFLCAVFYGGLRIYRKKKQFVAS